VQKKRFAVQAYQQCVTEAIERFRESGAKIIGNITDRIAALESRRKTLRLQGLKEAHPDVVSLSKALNTVYEQYRKAQQLFRTDYDIEVDGKTATINRLIGEFTQMTIEEGRSPTFVESIVSIYDTYLVSDNSPLRLWHCIVATLLFAKALASTQAEWAQVYGMILMHAPFMYGFFCFMALMNFGWKSFTQYYAQDPSKDAKEYLFLIFFGHAIFVTPLVLVSLGYLLSLM
jgi:hypothetical protein